MPLVFISYAHAEPAEAGLARLIVERLRRDGAELFFDERLRAGQDWNEAIEQALDRCDAFCLLLSATSLASPMVQNEIARIGERRRRHGTPAIWPIRCRHDGRLPYDLGAHLRRIQYLTWQGEADTAFTLDELLDRWRELRDGPQPEPPPPALCTLPGRIADFTGREPEIADLIAALCREDRRAAVSAIGGMGGAGKTTLAIEAAWRMAGRFPDGILYIDMLGFGMAPPLTPAQAAAAVIEQLEPTAKPPDGLEQLLPLYRRLLTGRKLLILLDNARDTAQVTGLVPPAPVALLVTSRHQLFLDGATRLNLDVLPTDDARTLLRVIVDTRRATDVELDTLVGLCGCLPLALRAAGTYLQSRVGLKVADYIEFLAAERTRLDHMKVPQALRDVRATLNLSATLLDTDDPDLAARWRQLAVFPSGFRPDAAAAVWGEPGSDAAASLDQLVSRSLLTREGETGRYRLHDLIRTTASEQLNAEIRQKAELRHAKHYSLILSEANCLYCSGGDKLKQGLDRFDEERWNIAEGRAWAAANARSDSASRRLMCAYTVAGAQILDLRLPKREWITWLRDALDVTNDQDIDYDISLALASVLRDTGNLRGSLEMCEQVRLIAQRMRSKPKEARALTDIGNAWRKLGESQKAVEFLELAVALEHQVGNRRGEARALNDLATAFYDLGQPKKVIEHCQQARSVLRAIDAKDIEADVLHSLEKVYIKIGKHQLAIELCMERVDIVRKLGRIRELGRALGDLGRAWQAFGNSRKAIFFIGKRRGRAHLIGDSRNEGRALRGLGMAWAALGKSDRALKRIEQAREKAREIGDRQGEVRALEQKGHALMQFGREDEALQCHQECKNIASKVKSRRDLSRALHSLGVIWHRRGDFGKAINYFNEQLQLASEMGDKSDQAKAWWSLAQSNEAQGNQGQALLCAHRSLVLHRQTEDPSTSKVEAWLREQSVDPDTVADSS